MAARFLAEILACSPKAKQGWGLLDFRKSSGNRPYLSHIALPLGPFKKQTTVSINAWARISNGCADPEHPAARRQGN
jgi:hypothetical protein